MVPYIFKFLIIFYLCNYMCLKIMHHNIKFKMHLFVMLIFSLLLAILIYILKMQIPEFAYCVVLLLLWIFISYYTSRPRDSFIATTIAFGLSYSLHAISSFMAAILISPIHNYLIHPNYALVPLTAVFHITLSMYLFRIKRFRKGMPFLFSKSYVNLATITCLCIIVFIVYKPTNRLTHKIHLLTLLFFISSLIILIYWWQHQITNSYKHKLELRELEALHTELKEKNQLINSLTQQNEELGRLIHRDNKLIPALEHAVCEFLSSNFEDLESMNKIGNSLLQEIRTLSYGRKNIISKIQYDLEITFSSDIVAVDTLIRYMTQRAKQNNILFSVHIDHNLKEYLSHFITTDNLTHLLGDLLDNAFYAVKNVSHPMVQLQLYKSNKEFIVAVADNGIPFQIQSLVNMGISKFTTHPDGSGIGLMDIWMIKENYHASLHISEYEHTSPFSKKISLFFDNRGYYSIQTWRKDVILLQSKRSDLQLYDYK